MKISFREWEVERQEEMKLEGKWDIKFSKGTVEAKADGRGGPGRRHGDDSAREILPAHPRSAQPTGQLPSGLAAR